MARLVGGLLAASTLAPPPVRAQLPDGRGPCAQAVDGQLRSWGVVAPPRPQPMAGDAVLRHWPTRHLGEWVVEVRDRAETSVLRVTPAATTRIAWSERCAVTTTERPRPAAAAPRFTDADLAALLARAPRGVIYVWSPHMPLSVEGYRTLVEAAAARGLAVDAVLDPAADRAFAEVERGRGGLPREALRVADSVELTFRDGLVHAPTVLAHARGVVVGSAYPGFHTPEEYGAFLDRVLAPPR